MEENQNLGQEANQAPENQAPQQPQYQQAPPPQQPQYQQAPPPQYQQQPFMPQAPAAAPGNGLSIASLILALAALVVPYAGIGCAVVGLILGILGKQKNKAVGAPTGMAMAGIIISIITLAISVLIVVLCSVCAAAANAELNSLLNDYNYALFR